MLVIRPKIWKPERSLSMPTLMALRSQGPWAMIMPVGRDGMQAAVIIQGRNGRVHALQHIFGHNDLSCLSCLFCIIMEPE